MSFVLVTSAGDVTSSRGSVDIERVRSILFLFVVHHIAVSVFSCTMGEECLLYYNYDDHHRDIHAFNAYKDVWHEMTTYIIYILIDGLVETPSCYTQKVSQLQVKKVSTKFNSSWPHVPIRRESGSRERDPIDHNY